MSSFQLNNARLPSASAPLDHLPPACPQPRPPRPRCLLLPPPSSPSSQVEGVRGDGASGWLAFDGLDLGITLIKPWSKLSITQLKPQRPPLRPLHNIL